MPYLERMVKAHASRPDLFPPGMFVEMEIRHDHWCPLLTQPDKVRQKQAGACECNAEITFELNGEYYQVTKRGNVVSVGQLIQPGVALRWQ